ncbi:hypothetical protein BGX31_009485 [Mortierella sp. GBA43]|nr:hypothetical protein BGX31_009485 [Mortierella sp. GBA43]
MFAMVAESNHALRPVDWDAVARPPEENEAIAETEPERHSSHHHARDRLDTTNYIETAGRGYRHASECLEAFESSIQQHKAKSQRIEPDLLTRHSRTSIIGLLGMRERGRRQPHVMKDLVLLKKTHNYGHATTFNFSSGSVVDMAFKESSLKVAVANVATQDIYNRTGNLLLCDFKNGVTRHMNGHEKQGEILQKMAVTVNDIKLSYSKEYFISGADDRKTMIWNSETGEHITTLDDSGASITRLAIMEHSLTGEDVFAASSCYGVIDIYSLDEYGQVKARNKQLAVQGGRRGISSLSFGYGFFWDCLAVGMEGMDNGLINEGLQGGVRDRYKPHLLLWKSQEPMKSKLAN